MDCLERVFDNLIVDNLKKDILSECFVIFKSF